MNDPSTRTISVDDILQGHTPEVCKIVQNLRHLIRQTAPEASESAHAVWHSIHYHDPRGGYFCGIFPQQDSVVLVFEFGVLLADPQNILEGTGKQVRQIRIRDQGEILPAALRDLILSSLALPASRKEKLAMIRAGARPAEGQP